MARVLPSCEQASVNENIAPKLKPVEKILFSSMHSCELKRSSIACRKATSSPPAFPQPRPLPRKSCPSGATWIVVLRHEQDVLARLARDVDARAAARQPGGAAATPARCGIQRAPATCPA